jgi:hypothetical protein
VFLINYFFAKVVEDVKLVQRLGQHIPNLSLVNSKLDKVEEVQQLAQFGSITLPQKQPHQASASAFAPAPVAPVVPVATLDTLQGELPDYIEWREFQGLKVPYDTRDIPDPCPHCPQQFVPACGDDNLTYPSACFAVCVGAKVASMGECGTV